jgi:putative transposase
MKGSRFSEEHIIGILREAEASAKTPEVCRRHGISDATSTSGKRSTTGWRYRKRAYAFSKLGRREK